MVLILYPPLIRNDRNPGSNWGTIIPDKLGDEAIWGIQAYITSDNELCEDTEWQGPYLITGINGKTPTPLNYKTYVYKLSDTKPNPPVSDDPKNPGNGWVDYPNTSGQWWQCIGNVNGKTEKVEEWSEVLPVNGRDGVAQDGKFTEFRFAKSTNDNAPDLNKKERSPQGWEKEQPTIDINAGESLWMITAVINPDDTLVDEWSDPTRISGEKGPKGDTGPLGPEGPAGSQGVSGIPGKFIEPRYCLGTSDDYDAEAPVSNEREPNGWSTTLPDVTEDKPYIWFIQATIVFEDNDDNIGEVSGKWSTPSRLSGTNGLDGIPGADGRKGQIVYPAGIYSLDEAYTCDDDKSPYVLDTNDRQFYLLNTKMTWIGREQNDQYPSQVPDHWTKLESFEAIYAKVGIIANGLVGSVVFNDQYMFSQQGVNSTGGTSSDFENFDPDVPIGGEFTPNILFDMQKGTGHLAQGKIKFDGDKITTGSIIIGENAAFAYEHITSVNDGKITKLHCSIDNLSGDTDFVFDFYDDFTSNKNQIYDGVVINGSRKIVTIKNFVGICSNFNQLAKYNTDPSINIDTISLYPGTTLNYYFTPDEALGGVFMIGNVSDFQMVVQTDSDSGVYKLKSKGPNSIFDLSYIAAVKVLLGTSDSVSFTAYPKDMNVNVIYGSGSPHAQKRLVITIDGWKWGGRIHSLAMPYLYGSMSPEQRITFTEFESTEKSVGLFIDPIKDGVSLDNWMYYVIVYLFALPYDLY